jgi:transglutaminase-like putative cysteine protease
MRLHRAFVVILTLCLAAPSSVLAQARIAKPADANRVSFTLSFRVTAKKGTDKVTVTALVPKNIENRQKIVKIKYSQKPESEFEENGNKYARFVLNNPVGVQVIKAEVEAELYRNDLSTAGKRRHVSESEEKLAAWLKSEKYIESDDKQIKQAAKLISGADEVDTLRNIMAFVNQKVRYSGFDEADHGAVWALQQGKGDCTEFCDLFVALCRAKNIPARVCEGYTVNEVEKADTPKHGIAEAYTRKYGWVPFDPLHVFRKNAGFDALKPVFVYLGNQRNDTVLENYHFSAYRYFGTAVEYDNSFAVTALRELKKK